MNRYVFTPFLWTEFGSTPLIIYIIRWILYILQGVVSGIFFHFWKKIRMRCQPSRLRTQTHRFQPSHHPYHHHNHPYHPNQNFDYPSPVSIEISTLLKPKSKLFTKYPQNIQICINFVHIHTIFVHIVLKGENKHI